MTPELSVNTLKQISLETDSEIEKLSDKGTFHLKESGKAAVYGTFNTAMLAIFAGGAKIISLSTGTPPVVAELFWNLTTFVSSVSAIAFVSEFTPGVGRKIQSIVKDGKEATSISELFRLADRSAIEISPDRDDFIHTANRSMFAKMRDESGKFKLNTEEQLRQSFFFGNDKDKINTLSQVVSMGAAKERLANRKSKNQSELVACPQKPRNLFR